MIQNAGLDGLRGVSDGSYLIAYGILAAAALLPPARSPDARSADTVTFGRRRLVLLGIALVGAPVCAGLAPALDYAAQAPIYIAVAALVSCTVMIRLVGLVRRLEEERRRLRAAESELAFRATHDELTELPNRAFLIRSLTAALEERAAVGGHGLAVMFIDLDNFKFVNDSLGHRAGDQLLGHVGRRIRQAMKGSDLVARLGGDEFVVLCRGVLDGHEAERIASRALDALAAPFSLEGDVAYTAASIGIGLAGDSHDAATLLRDADLALYQAKAAGGRCARVFDDTMQAWAEERTSVETGLRRALDRGELGVVYQPRVDLATGRIRSLEALLRWPGRPDVPIPRLIDVAEASGLIDEIGWFVLSRACDDLARLNAAAGPRHPVSVAVNVSMRQINRGTFVEDVQRTIAMHGVDASLISLELTETFLAAEPERALAMLTALRAVGVRLEIDDFGTGYSSLGRLRLFPLDGLKIDRSFVAGLGEDPSAESLIATIVALAGALRPGGHRRGDRVRAAGGHRPRRRMRSGTGVPLRQARAARRARRAADGGRPAGARGAHADAAEEHLTSRGAPSRRGHPVRRARRSRSSRPSTPNSSASKRSSTPPWPSSRRPESFAPASRLSIDSKRSPRNAAGQIDQPQRAATASRRSSPCRGRRPRRPRWPPTRPTTAPSTVFLGEVQRRDRPRAPHAARRRTRPCRRPRRPTSTFDDRAPRRGGQLAHAHQQRQRQRPGRRRRAG